MSKPKPGLLAGSTLASRFPTVMRLLTGASASADDDQQRDEGDALADDEEDAPGNDTDESQEETDGGDGGDQTDDGGDGGGRQVGETEGAPGAGANVLNLDRPVSSAELMEAFGRDADRLVAAERDRCIAVFTSDAGRRNVDGAAAVLRDTTMDAERASSFLATCSGGRTNARDRIRNADATRVDTGTGRADQSATDDVKAEHRKRQQARNKIVKGGKKVGDPAAPAADGND